MKTIAQRIGIGVSLLIFLLIARWSDLVAFNMKNRLHKFASAIRASDRSLEDKEQLLEEIDAVIVRLDGGAKPSMWEWTVHDRAIRRMLDDGITGDEGRLIERELQKAEAELAQ